MQRMRRSRRGCVFLEDVVCEGCTVAEFVFVSPCSDAAYLDVALRLSVCISALRCMSPWKAIELLWMQRTRRSHSGHDLCISELRYVSFCRCMRGLLLDAAYVGGHRVAESFCITVFRWVSFWKTCELLQMRRRWWSPCG